MRFIRPFCMSEAEAQMVEKLTCPSCGQDSSAIVTLAYPNEGETLIDIACDSCGCQWQVKAQTASDGVRMRVENDLKNLSVNKLKHMTKKKLAELADPLGYKPNQYTRDLLLDILLRRKRELEEES